GQLLVFGVVLCDMIMARCFRYAVLLVNVLLSWAGMHVSNWLTGRPHQAKPAELTAGAIFVAEQQNSHSARPIRSGHCMAHSSDFPMTTNIGSVTCCGRVIRRLIIMGVSLGVF